MANSIIGGGVNGHVDVPPSTLAAQIVHNIESAGERLNSSTSRAHVQELLKLILEDGDLNNGSQRSSRESLEENRRLVIVTVKICLGNITNDDPFQDQATPRTEASQCLAVVQLMVARHPEIILLSHHDSAAAISRPLDPLFVWLLPSLLCIQRHSKWPDVQDAAAKAVLACVISQSKPLPTRLGLQPVTRFLQGCVSDIISRLVAFEEFGDASAGSAGGEVPSPNTLRSLAVETATEQDGLSPLVFNNTCEDVTTLLCVLSSCSQPGKATDSTEAHWSVPDLGWTIESLFAVLAQSWSESHLSSLNDRTFATLQDLLRSCISRSMAVEDLICSRRSTQLACRCLAFSLREPKILNGLNVETATCLMIACLISAAHNQAGVRQLYVERLHPSLEDYLEDPEQRKTLSPDLQRALACLRRIGTSSGQSMEAMLDFDSLTLREEFEKIRLESPLANGQDLALRPTKRLRSLVMEAGATGHAQALLDDRICEIFGSSAASSSDRLHYARNNFVQLTSEDQCLLFSAISDAVCANASGMAVLAPCTYCKNGVRMPGITAGKDLSFSGQVHAAVKDIAKQAQNQRSTKPRILSLLTIKRVLAHSSSQAELDIRSNAMGLICAQSLRSTSRDVRLAALSASEYFFAGEDMVEILRQNRLVCLDLWRSRSEKNELVIQETCILGLGVLARTSPEEDEMNIVLLSLLDYLGHHNAFISSLAYEELSKLTASGNKSLWQIFEPFWRTLAVSIVKSLNSRPQIAQSVCDLLSTSVTDLLRRTQFFTLPYLVFKGQSDVLQKIATANGPDVTVHALCFQHGQLASILCFLLLQPSEDSDNLVVESMSKACGGLTTLSLPDLLKCDTMYMAYELLKAAGEQEESTRPRALQLLQALSDLSQSRSRTSRSSQVAKREAVGTFFESWALAIVQLLSETITNAKGTQAIFERKRCIGALSEMAALAGNRLGSALPQIRSCLQFAFQDAKLRNEAFIAWFTLVEALEKVHVAILLDQTLALLVTFWTSLDDTTQSRAQMTITFIFKNHGDLVQNEVQTLPSLSGITILSKFEAELAKFRKGMDARSYLSAFTERCQSETVVVVSVALKELEIYVGNNIRDYQALVTNEQPDPVVGLLARSLLDSCVRFKEQSNEIAICCARCLGLLGCLDPFRVDTPRNKMEMFVLWNFVDRLETVDFVLFFLEQILVKVYLTATITNRQQILAFGMQELLKLCDMESTVKCRRGDPDDEYRRWIEVDEPTRNVLTPFLTSKYVINTPALVPAKQYPIYTKGMKYARWIHDFVLDILQRGQGQNARLVFSICRRLVRNQDTSIANFLLPYVVLNIVIEGSRQDFEDVIKEFEAVLTTSLRDMNAMTKQHLIQCSQSMFSVVDYLSRWIQEKKRSLAGLRARAATKEHELAEPQIQRIESLLGDIPANVMSSRAADCQSFSRSLFYWEQHMRKERTRNSSKETMQPLYERLQDIYVKIDEPDGIEGLSSWLESQSIEQQILEDRNAGRWSVVQSWHELQLADAPGDADAQLNLVKSLRESGQHDAMLSLISDLSRKVPLSVQLGSYAVEASWTTSRWEKLAEYTKVLAGGLPAATENFNIGIGDALRSLHEGDEAAVHRRIESLFLESTRPLTLTSTATLQGCHTSMLQFHVLFELEMIAGRQGLPFQKADVVKVLEDRLDMLSTFPPDQKYLLGIRRAAMQLTGKSHSGNAKFFNSTDVSATLLKTAKLARKGGYNQHAFNAVLRAMHEGSPSARIEYAKLMWDEGQHRRAIQTLEDAITVNAFDSADILAAESTATVTTTTSNSRQNPLGARAHLLLAKWIDRAGQTASKATVERYRAATQLYPKWEKSYYLLGKHYNKLLESEKANRPEKQAQTYITGEMAKLVIENFVRSVYGGTKYIYQTLPKLLTLWLDLGAEVEKPLEPKHGDQSFRDHASTQRKKIFEALMKTVEKYVNTRLPAYVFYTAFSQIVARITHPNKEVYLLLVEIIAKVVAEHPQQAMWPLLAMMKSKASSERVRRGLFCRNKVLEKSRQFASERKRKEMPDMFTTGQKLTDQLVELCDKPVEQQLKNPVSLQHNFGFIHRRATPCRLVIPIESTLQAKLPPASNSAKNWDAFKDSVVTIDQFLDEATVLSSLAKPRKVKIRGSNGKVYSLLCKPKDDLRKDQRLLEFNSMISRILKRDAECSKRRLYIKTYAVTPLNEECGLIEWVDGMRTLREILLNSYRQMGISIDYDSLRVKLNVIAKDVSQVHVFTKDILSQFPPILHDWFVDQFREPDTWFHARLRYTRSCAVMSMVGHVLGLGDRHGENILLEEAAGGTFHVDFNCLFDKGKTFETPERVPFRLTHNMVDAFGAYRENGPFRRSCELAMGILRQNEDTLMTILETFLYDPTQDFIGKRKQRPQHSEVPVTPQGVLESVRSKVRGLLPMESVPLSVEGYVQLQIQEATDAHNLARMYIGWSAFL